MPPRYAYWTIIADGLPTAFRATEREELMPTYRRLREKHPDAVMKWFARGKLWDSPEQARSDNAGGRDRGRDEPRGDDRPTRAGGRDQRDRRDGPPESRDRNWRPGGEHRDPRQKFKDAKKARNLDRRHEKFARKHGVPRDERGDTRPPREKPHGDALLEPPRRPSRAPQDRFSERPQAAGSPAPRPRDRKGGWQKPGSQFREKPHGDPLRAEIDGARRSAREPVRDRRESDQSGGAGSQRHDRGRYPAPSGPQKDDWRNNAPRESRGERGPKSDHRDRPKWADRPTGPAGPRKDQWRDGARRETRGDREPKPEHRDRPKWSDRPAGPAGPRKDQWRDGARRETHGARGPKPEHRDRPKWSDRPAGPAGPRKDQWRDGARRETHGARGPKPEHRDRPKWSDRPAGPAGPRKDQWRDRQLTPREKPHGDPLRKDVAGSAPRRDERRESTPRSDQRFQRPDRFSKNEPSTDWRGRPPAPKNRPHGDPLGRPANAPRAFKPGGFIRGQGTDEPRTPPRPPGPNREPAPSERPEPSPPPRPSEPSVLPPGPPERGEPNTDRPRRPRRDRE